MVLTYILPFYHHVELKVDVENITDSVFTVESLCLFVKIMREYQILTPPRVM